MMQRYSMRVVWSPEDQAFVASCPELGGLSTHGDSPQEATANLSEAMELAIRTYEEGEWPLPAPRTLRAYSGQFRVRLPESLHAWLAGEAEAEGVSLNTFVVATLSEARGTSHRHRARSAFPFPTPHRRPAV